MWYAHSKTRILDNVSNSLCLFLFLSLAGKILTGMS